MRKVLIIGATSAIAAATARILAQQGDNLFLVARSQEKLDILVADLNTRRAGKWSSLSQKVSAYCMDANNYEDHVPMLDAAEQAMGGVDTVLIAHGTLSDQRACQQSVDLTMQEINTNGLSVIALLTHIANRFEKQKNGTIAVISSVAGDRGRQSNYVYGSAKAMVTSFTSGLRQRLHKSGVTVLTIKPGFVDTPMTADLDKSALWSTPEKVAERIVMSFRCKCDVIYTPWFWRGIMRIIKAIPETIFKRLSL